MGVGEVPDVTVMLAEAFLVLSASETAVRVTPGGVGTLAGAV